VVCVACPPGPLLTTREQWDSWQASEGQNGQLAASVEEAVAQAVRCGQDSAGRFQRAAEWLSQRQRGVAYPGGLCTKLPGGDLWTAWEPRPGDWAEDTLIATRPATLSGMSWALLMVFLLAAWRARLRPGRGRYGVLVLWLGLAGMALLWLPASMRPFVWRSFLPGIAVACIWYLWSALRSSPGLGAPNPVAAGSAVLALAMVTCLPGQAAAPGPQTVLLLPGTDRAPDKESVLAPGELLEQLRSLARRGARGLQGAVILDAKYEGTVNDGIAEFKAEFQVQSFSDGSTSLTLPISGIELQEALLDGSTAYPVALAVPLHAYSFQIKERGRHKVQVRFALRDSAAGAEHELRCAIPEIVQSQLKLRVPAGASYLRTDQGRGA